MAKLAKTATIERLDAEDGDHYEIDTGSGNGQKARPQMTDAEEALFDFWELSVNAGADAYIVIMRLIEGQGATRQQLCERVPIDKYDYYSLQMYIRDAWGSGDYRLLLFGPDPRRGGKRTQLQNQLISIASPLSKSTELAIIPGQGPQSGESVTMALLREIREMRMEARQQPLQPVKSPIEQIQEMAQLMTVLKTAFGTDEKKEDGVTVLIKQMTQLKALEKIMKGEDPDDKDDEKGGIGNRIMGILETMGPGLAQMIMAQSSRPQARPQPRPQPRPVNPASTATKPEETVKMDPKNLTPEQTAVVKEYLGKAVWAARMKMDPEAIARQAVEQNPDAVAQLLAVPDLLTESIRLEPAIAGHRQWFDDLVEWAKGHLGEPSRFDDEFADADDSTNVADDSTNVADENEQSPID